MFDSRRRLILAVMLVAMSAAIGGTAVLRATQSQGPTHSDELVGQLQGQLAVAKDPEVIASLQEKLQIAKDSQQQERDANQSPIDDQKAKEKNDKAHAEATANAVGKVRIHAPREPAGLGFIVEGMQPPFPSVQFLQANLWLMEVGDGSRQMVWSGADGMDPQQGELALVNLGASGQQRFQGFYPTPGAHGTVRVIAASGTVLELEAADGTRFLFDVITREYR